MNHYNHFSVEDFIQDSRFRSWVRNPSAEEDVIWQNWINENIHMSPLIDEARAIVLSVHPIHSENITDTEIEREIGEVLAMIHSAEDEKVNAQPSRSAGVPWLKIAASISILLAFGWFGTEYTVKDRMVDSEVIAPENIMIERVNRSTDPLLISLPDNSSVLLSHNSVIRYPRQFKEDRRNVFLKGVAFFEVTKDADKPFYVSAGKIVAKVLGTSFEISADSLSGQTRVVVKSGRVSVFSNANEADSKTDREPDVILTANEQFVLRDNMSQIQHTRLNSLPAEIVPDTYLKFTATPAAKVFEALARVYGVTIRCENAQIDKCSVTASFTDEPFALKLDLICRSIGVNYEIMNDQVTVTGNGCKN